MIKKKELWKREVLDGLKMKGITMMISNSKIKNKILNIKKLWDRGIWWLDILLNPHSNGEFRFLFVFSFQEIILFMVMMIIISKMIMSIGEIFISLFFLLIGS